MRRWMGEKKLTEERVADKSLPEKPFFARFEFKKKTSSQNYCDLGINYFHNLQKKKWEGTGN